MVERHLTRRGIRSERVLEALKTVPREKFLPAALREFAYDDTPLPIDEGQTISQPFMVAMMTEALDLRGHERVLEIGTGSGYAAAVLSRVAKEVFSVERIGALADTAKSRLRTLGYNNVRVLHADGTRGWPEQAPYDAIIVAAGGPSVPESLKSQLKVGGRLVIPVGAEAEAQELVRITRVGETQYTSEDLADVRFVPLLGAEGWPTKRQGTDGACATLAEKIGAVCEPFHGIDSCYLKPLLDRVGDARLVLLGEATHGTAEFYRMRARITRELIQQKGFSFVAIEGDWPDAARIDHYIQHREVQPSQWIAFARFPTWMWRNREFKEFVDWLRVHNADVLQARRVAFHGLDLYSLHSSIRAVLSYLESVDPAAARIARVRYGCLTPWQADPAVYGHAALTGRYRTCEPEVTSMLKELLQKQQIYAIHDGARFLDAVQNARLIANAEHYYRLMYYGSRASWNLRDSHMFETLRQLFSFYGPESKGVVWAHNSHVGDSAATDMAARQELNLGHLCHQEWRESCYRIGFGTDHGTVAAASNWDEPMEIKTVRPALAQSYEHLCHRTPHRSFMLPLRALGANSVVTELRPARLERAIGVIYRPETEMQSHYFSAVLPDQFDEYVWLDETHAVSPLRTEELKGLPDTYPFGL